jgi:hypothetical protein
MTGDEGVSVGKRRSRRNRTGSLTSGGNVAGRCCQRADVRPQYPDGHFPPGPFFTEETLPALAGQTFSADKTVLFGREYLFLGQVNGEYMFGGDSTKFLAPTRTPRTVLTVRFFGNIPNGLRPGRLIAPNKRSSLTLRKVASDQ